MRKINVTLVCFSLFIAYLISWKYDGTIIYDLAGSAIVLILTLAYLLKHNIDDGLSFPVMFFPLFSVAWVMWFGASTFWSQDPYTSWFAFWELASLPLTALIYILIPDSVKDLAWKNLWILVLVSTWALILMGLYQEFNWMRPGFLLVNLRPYGPLLDTNSFATWMDLIFFPTLVYFIYHDTQRSTPFISKQIDVKSLMYMVTIGLITVVYFTTDSRGWELAWICTFPLLVWGVHKITKTWRYSAMVAGLIVLSGAIVGYVHNYNMFLHMSPHYIGTHASTVSRMLMWVSAWHMYLAYPWTGTGLGTYFLVYPQFRSVLESASAGTYDHNDYLQFLVEGGPINLLMLLLFVLFVVYTLYRILISKKSMCISDKSRLEALGLALGLYAVCGHAVGNFIFYNMPIALLSGLFAARLWWITNEPKWKTNLLSRINIDHPYIIKWVMYVGVAVVVVDLSLDAYSYIIFQDNIVSKHMSVTSFQKLRYESAVVLSYLRPVDVIPHTELGNMYVDEFGSLPATKFKQKQSLIKGAIHQFTMEEMPQKSNIYYVLGSIYSKDYAYLNMNVHEGQEKALYYDLKALHYKPNYIDARYAASKAMFRLSGGSIQGARKAISFMKEGINTAIFRQKKAKDAWIVGLELYGLEHNYYAAMQWDLAHLRSEPWYIPWTKLVIYMHKLAPVS